MENKIKTLVLAFEKATAERNIKELNEILHPDYRVMANRFKGSAGTTLIPRAQYLKMLEGKQIGGTHYKTEFLHISVTQHTAMVEVFYKSEVTSDMHKYLFLVQNENDDWQVISDLPIVVDQ